MVKVFVTVDDDWKKRKERLGVTWEALLKRGVESLEAEEGLDAGEPVSF